MEPLTEKQNQVLQFIEGQLRVGKPPSQREIAKYFGLSRNAICQLLDYLKKKDYLEDLGGHRGLRLSKEYLQRKKETEGIPVVGRVAAGEPILAQENIDRYANLNDLLGLPEDAFLLKVAGDSMIDEGILDGDYVVVRPSKTIENGKIVVVLLDDETTVKRIYVQRGRIALQPASKAAGYKTKYVKRGSRKVQVIGRVIGCIRKI